MSDQTTPEPEQPASDAVEPTDVEADDAEHADAEHADAKRSHKVPLWAWILGGVVVAAGIVVAILAGSGAFSAPEPLPTPPAETITAPPPSPRAEPVAREGEPTAFSAALPDTVLDLSLADFAPGGRFDETRALESFSLAYSDGAARSVALEAGQFEDPEAATRAFTRLVGDQSPVESGEVNAGGVAVGEFAQLVADDGSTVLVWRNTTAVFILSGEEALVRDVFTAFPL